ncbi:4'-phosphopantetheinyl transferase family protein [Duganella callida]|uniref:4'-phosphopantetheinyl transferase family protein n=1 Tax=Duganella callida TaxID=2561932 RepID=UPI001430722E|nr:4'-phosphopantetheinyl transferase superfamily protein [Duganella callida]
MSPKWPETLRLWQADLDDAGWDRHAAVLHPEEEARAQRYRTPRLAQHYRRGRSMLRLLLARQSGGDPARIALRYGWAGKPEADGLSCHFNLSHSGRQALIALAPYPVGVDIESTAHANISMTELAGLVCHPDEQAALAALAPLQREDFLYRLWVQKEAYCKALGTGLQAHLRALSFAPTADAALAVVHDAARPATDVHYVRYWRAAGGCAAAVCLPSPLEPPMVTQLVPD